MLRTRLAVFAFVLALTVPLSAQKPQLGYYRFPAIWADTIVFTAEGDLWRVGVSGGIAQRLTTHPEEESRPAISRDGRTVAFAASYEGPGEVYTLPLDGGIPTRQTWDASRPAWISQNIRLAHEYNRRLDPMWNVIRRESIGRETPRPPRSIAWSRTTSTSSSASGTSATSGSMDSGGPSSGASSNRSSIAET